MPNTPWDERSLRDQRRQQNILLRQTILQMALGHVPYVRAKLASMGLDARAFKGLEELYSLPLTMRRDIFDERRNPEGTRAVILRGTAEGVKRFSDRATLRRVARARWAGGEEMQELAIESAMRPIHMHLVPGPGGRLPVAYTRDDLDLLARAGARLASLVGLQREDRLLNLVPFGATLDFWGTFYMAHGVGMTAVHARRDGLEIAKAVEAFDDARATAIAVAADETERFADLLRAGALDVSSLRSVVFVGRSLTIEERATAGEALLQAGATDATIAAAYGPAEGHVLWGECSVPAGRTETFGFHTFPDLDLVEVISPETGQPLGEREAGEVVLTTLGFRGGGVPRWRTGDLALGGLTTEPCPNCGRTVPRVGPSVQRAAWQRVASLNGRATWLDLTAVGVAASERASKWQVELAPGARGEDLLVYLAGADTGQVIDLYEDLLRVRVPTTQIVLGSDGQIDQRIASAPGPWPRFWDRTV